MNILKMVLVGIVQGLTEFMPVSSSGHLVLIQRIFGLDKPGLTYEVILHIGTLIPIIIVFWQDIVGLLKKPFQKTTYLLITATIPAVVFTLIFDKPIEQLFQGGRFLSLGFIITGFVLLFASSLPDGYKEMKDISVSDAVLIGCMQAIAIAPAISRSGSTISGALTRKLTRETAAKFSFLMSIPAILGATVMQAKDIVTGNVVIPSADIVPMLFGFVAAMLSGYLSIRFMLKIIKECKLKYFSYYVFALAALIIADQFFFKTFFS